MADAIYTAKDLESVHRYQDKLSKELDATRIDLNFEKERADQLNLENLDLHRRLTAIRDLTWIGSRQGVVKG